MNKLEQLEIDNLISITGITIGSPIFSNEISLVDNTNKTIKEELNRVKELWKQIEITDRHVTMKEEVRIELNKILSK